MGERCVPPLIGLPVDALSQRSVMPRRIRTDKNIYLPHSYMLAVAQPCPSRTG